MLEVHRALHQLFDRKLVTLEDDVLHIPDCEALSGFLDPRSPTSSAAAAKSARLRVGCRAHAARRPPLDRGSRRRCSRARRWPTRPTDLSELSERLERGAVRAHRGLAALRHRARALHRARQRGDQAVGPHAARRLGRVQPQDRRGRRERKRAARGRRRRGHGRLRRVRARDDPGRRCTGRASNRRRRASARARPRSRRPARTPTRSATAASPPAAVPNPDDADPWVLRSEEAELEVEGYATARNTTFDVFGVPVAWIPWMIFPVKTERQTGLLFPEFSLGSFHGFDFGLPFFWAINDQAGLVLTPRYSVKRGPGGAARFDYVVGRALRRRDAGRLLPRPGDRRRRRRRSRSAATAGAPHGVHDWSLPGAPALRDQLPLRLRQRRAVRLPRARQSTAPTASWSRRPCSRASVGSSGARTRAWAARFVDDLQNPDDLDRDRFLLQRWPTDARRRAAGRRRRAHRSSCPRSTSSTRGSRRASAPSTSCRPRWSARAGCSSTRASTRCPIRSRRSRRAASSARCPTRTATTSRCSGGTEGDGFFQEGEPLTDRGHRLLLQPRLALPLDCRGVSLVPEVGWHETLYDSRVRDFRERGFVTDARRPVDAAAPAVRELRARARAARGLCAGLHALAGAQRRCSCPPPRCRSTASARSTSISSRATTPTGSRARAASRPASATASTASARTARARCSPT